PDMTQETDGHACDLISKSNTPAAESALPDPDLDDAVVAKIRAAFADDSLDISNEGLRAQIMADLGIKIVDGEDEEISDTGEVLGALPPTHPTPPLPQCLPPESTPGSFNWMTSHQFVAIDGHLECISCSLTWPTAVKQ